MAVSHDASSESHTGTTGSTSEASFGNAGSSSTWNHAGSASAKAAVVGVFTLADADYISGVTYGGVAMTQRAEAADTLNEPLRMTLFELAGCPTGTQNIVVSRTNNATPMYAICHTVLAASTVEVYAAGIVLLQENQTLSEQNVDDGSPGTNSLRIAFVGSGLGSAPAAGANSTIGQGINISAASCRSYYETTPGQGSRPIGASSGTADDVAAIHFAIREVPGGVSGTIGLVTETDSAFAITPLRTHAIGLSTETDTAFGMTPLRVHALGLVSETDAAFAMASAKAKAIGLTSENDTAFGFTAAKRVTIGIGTETDSGFSMAAQLAGSIGIATETDSAFDMAHSRVMAISIAAETDSALPATIRRIVLVGIGTEADSAFALAHAKAKAIDIAQETDTAQSVLVVRVPQIALAMETDTAFAFTVAGVNGTLFGVKRLDAGYSTIITLKASGSVH